MYFYEFRVNHSDPVERAVERLTRRLRRNGVFEERIAEAAGRPRVRTRFSRASATRAPANRLPKPGRQTLLLLMRLTAARARGLALEPGLACVLRNGWSALRVP